MKARLPWVRDPVGTNVDNYWDEPSASRYLDRLASFSRVILFDKLGTGVSDPIPGDKFPGTDFWSTTSLR